jgi:hypothetical protein
MASVTANLRKTESLAGKTPTNNRQAAAEGRSGLSLPPGVPSHDRRRHKLRPEDITAHQPLAAPLASRNYRRPAAAESTDGYRVFEGGVGSHSLNGAFATASQKFLGWKLGT